MDMIATDESPANISDKIKELLFAKSAEKIDSFRPTVATSFFGLDDQELVDDEEQYEEEEE